MALAIGAALGPITGQRGLVLDKTKKKMDQKGIHFLHEQRAMVLWVFTTLFLLVGLKSFLNGSKLWKSKSSLTNQRRNLRTVMIRLREIEEILMAGLVPSANQWGALRNLFHPWGTLSGESLEGLRACGGSLLPTLRRLRKLAEEQDQCLASAQAKASQAFAQALACSALVPVLGTSLYFLLPSIQENLRSWVLLNASALILAALGAFWLIRMTDEARWGGLRSDYRSWSLGAQCAGERFLALVRTGVPPDLSWVKTCELLSKETSSLSDFWGPSVWDTTQPKIAHHRSGPASTRTFRPAENSIVSAGISIKKAVQVSLMEGRPCVEKVETVLLALSLEMKAHVERELSLLSTRALKPLFICVAPGLMSILIYGIWIVFVETTRGDFNAF